MNLLNPIQPAPPSPTHKNKREGEGRAKKRSCFRDEAIRKQAESQLPKGLLNNRRKRVDSLELVEACVLKGADLKVQEVAKVLAAKRSDHAVILDDEDRVVGIVTDKDLCFRVLGEGLDPANCAIKEVMTLQPTCLTVDDGLGVALQMMIERGFRHMPVLSAGGGVVGMLDIAKCVQVNLGRVERAERATAELEAALEAVGKEFGPGVTDTRIGDQLKGRLSSPQLNSIAVQPAVAVDLRLSAFECIQR